tara:strand:- start:410538 stop:411686 length:1149 start_codon:yes stop_codon:yes gene_type:complete
MSKPLTYAMIGGGIGASIGQVHRRAIALDGRATLVAGVLSSTPERSILSAKAIGLDLNRSYQSYQEFFKQESTRDDRVDFVSIVTPNDTHYPIAKAALEHGFHVVLDKPATHTSQQAIELEDLASSKGLVCCVTYNYTGYPMIRQARAMVRDGKLGSIRKIYLEYHQGWLASDLESGGHKQASWRVDPAKAGLGGALGDIGTHAENLISFVTGLPIQSVYANLRAFVPNRVLDDDVSVFINFQQGAHGVLTASQVCIGEANGISLRIYGDKGGLSWYQQSENDLSFTELNGQTTIFTRNGVGLHTDSLLSAFTPPGHPEGYLEAFSNIYRGAIDAVLSKRDGIEESQLAKLIPSMKDGAQGVKFVEKCVESAEENTQVDWVS